MAYDGSIPKSNVNISDSRRDIRDNFYEINLFLNENHEGFDIPSTGNHYLVEMPIRTNLIPYETEAEEVALHSKTSLVSGIPEMVYIPAGSYEMREFTSAVKAVNGATVLPSGIIIRWGRAEVMANADTEINFPVFAGIPAFSDYPINYQLTPSAAMSDESGVYLRLSGFDSFTVYSSSTFDSQIHYVVMGY